MKTLSTLMLILGFSLAVIPASVRADDKLTKESYLNKVESQLSDWDSKLSSLKEEQHKLGKDTPRYEKLESRTSKLESDIKQAREEVAELKSNTDKDWSGDRKDIDKALSAIQHDYNEAKAE